MTGALLASGFGEGSLRSFAKNLLIQDGPEWRYRRFADHWNFANETLDQSLVFTLKVRPPHGEGRCEEGLSWLYQKEKQRRLGAACVGHMTR